ncbi:MAG: dynamin family protein [Campylobacter sp.]|nr:dynamin family protein [Campylobacter sp.]
MDKFLTEIWGDLKLFLDDRTLIIAEEKILATLLACNARNYERFTAIKEFKQILHSLGLKTNLYSIQSGQIGAINAIRSSKISKQKIIDALKILQIENIISQTEFKNLDILLNDIIESKNETSVKNSKKIDIFHRKIDVLNAILQEISALEGSRNFTTKLQSAKQKIDELKFNIVVTGVINAGKSTMLNALLDAEILGTSNVPETINLTLLKHSNAPYATVKFWSEEEIKELGYDLSAECAKFIGTDVRIKTHELKNYTSATSEYAKFVKNVELYENLELLKDNICIIDTPGIDDAVDLREKLVRDFMSESDLMVHLMNVSQSTTQKDVEFIAKSVKNSHIVKLVVILTHIDLLSKDELSEVMVYAKKSLNERFGDDKKDKFSIDFFAVSAKDYLDGKPNSGMENFKIYLYETFFGENNQKSRLSLEAYKKELIAVCEEFLTQTKQKILNLVGSNLNLNEKFSKLNTLWLSLQSEFQEVKSAMRSELAKLDISGLDTDFDIGLKTLMQTLRDRILNEVDFAKRSKNKLEVKRADYIIQSALNDGIIGIMRQNRNEILKRIKACKNNIALKFSDFKPNEDDKIFSINDYLSLKGIQFETNDVCKRINSALNLETNRLTTTIDSALGEFLSDEKIKNFVFELSEFEKQEFQKEIDEIMQDKKDKFEASKELLNGQIALLAETNDEMSQELANLQNVESCLNAINSELKNV